jgi:hypothetical protein
VAVLNRPPSVGTVSVQTVSWTGTSVEKEYTSPYDNGGSTQQYIPSHVESYIMEHSKDLGYHITEKGNRAAGCAIWKDPEASSIYGNLQTFRTELQDYGRRLKGFNGTVKDLRHHLTDTDKRVCDTLELHEGGLLGIFPQSLSLSAVPGAGFVEPLVPPQRHPEFCFGPGALMDLGYVVNDYASLCRNKLKRHSRTILIDMGAALDFHGDMMSPAVYITQTFQRFGFKFDHIYAYEIVKKDPTDVFTRIPDDLKAAYHWYNVGVDADISSSNNPLKMLLEEYNEDDFVVIKLDIDTSSIEVPMVQLLLTDPRFHKLVDVFYFEHHVFLKELAPYWGPTMSGSVEDSLKNFTTLRERGIASHFWP